MLKRIAVLIDADNASAKTIDDVFSAIAKLGHVATKKIYGDWGQAGLSGWQEAILRHAIDPMQQFAYVKGKNATDIAMVIEAMDLLHSGEYDGFCLVSSDSDFASLAVRIRKGGIKVYGFGRKEAVISFRQACDEFFEVEKLSTKPQSTQQTNVWDNKKLKGDTRLMNALKDSLTQTIKDGEWGNYAQIASHFKKHHADIDIKTYGYHKLIQLYQVIDVFSVNTDKESKQLIIKLKNNNTTTSNQKYTTKQLQADKVLVDEISKLITNNPKSDNGWCNASYIASELNKNPNINLEKYGYKKFSELIVAIRLFDIQKQPNGVYIKNKTPKNPPPKPQGNQATPKPPINNVSIITGKIDIIVCAPEADVVLWRLDGNKKVRHDGDMIFYGQTHSADGLIHLEIHEIFTYFSCTLLDDDGIQYVVLTASSQSDTINHTKLLSVVIEQAEQQIFETQYELNDNDAKSMLFLALCRKSDGWQIVSHHQMLKNDLRQLCQVFGVEVDD